MTAEGASPAPRDEKELRAQLEQLTAQAAELRAGLPPFDEERFRKDVTAMMEKSGDPELHEAVWDYREGKIDRFELRRHPAYAKANAARWQDRAAQMEAAGVLSEYRSRVQEIAARVDQEDRDRR